MLSSMKTHGASHPSGSYIQKAQVSHGNVRCTRYTFFCVVRALFLTLFKVEIPNSFPGSVEFHTV